MLDLNNAKATEQCLYVYIYEIISNNGFIILRSYLYFFALWIHHVSPDLLWYLKNNNSVILAVSNFECIDLLSYFHLLSVCIDLL